MISTYSGFGEFIPHHDIEIDFTIAGDLIVDRDLAVIYGVAARVMCVSWSREH